MKIKFPRVNEQYSVTKQASYCGAFEYKLHEQKMHGQSEVKLTVENEEELTFSMM